MVAVAIEPEHEIQDYLITVNNINYYVISKTLRIKYLEEDGYLHVTISEMLNTIFKEQYSDIDALFPPNPFSKAIKVEYNNGPKSEKKKKTKTSRKHSARY